MIFFTHYPFFHRLFLILYNTVEYIFNYKRNLRKIYSIIYSYQYKLNIIKALYSFSFPKSIALAQGLRSNLGTTHTLYLGIIMYNFFQSVQRWKRKFLVTTTWGTKYDFRRPEIIYSTCYEFIYDAICIHRYITRISRYYKL